MREKAGSRGVTFLEGGFKRALGRTKVASGKILLYRGKGDQLGSTGGKIFLPEKPGGGGGDRFLLRRLGEGESGGDKGRDGKHRTRGRAFGGRDNGGSGS